MLGVSTAEDTEMSGEPEISTAENNGFPRYEKLSFLPPIATRLGLVVSG